MKANLHPVYGPSRVVCVCGNTFETRGTKAEVRVEICSACHPFYTGKSKLVDREGRVERFMNKYKNAPGVKKA
jgi:large subunit ribosomal protein L31